MKNTLFCIPFFLIALLFTSCISSDGERYANLSDNLVFTVLEGSVKVESVDTEQGKKSIKAKRELDDFSNMNYSIKKPALYLIKNDIATFQIEGNHILMVNITSLDEASKIEVTYRGESNVYTVRKTDALGKTLNFSNSF